MHKRENKVMLQYSSFLISRKVCVWIIEGTASSFGMFHSAAKENRGGGRAPPPPLLPARAKFPSRRPRPLSRPADLPLSASHLSLICTCPADSRRQNRRSAAPILALPASRE
eukprot:scaffold21401_cov27-Tisochrysis_lutea.AAC.5